MKHVQAWILFTVLFAFRVVFVVLGLFLIPIAYIVRKGERFRKPFWLWSNDEDGIFGPHWFNQGVKNFKTCYQWSAIRNPANNMRYTRFFSVHHDDVRTHIIKGDIDTPNPKQSRVLGRAMAHYTLVKANGLWYPSYWYLKGKEDNKHFRVRIGFKCTPEWIRKPRAKAYEYAGLTIQFMPNRAG